MLLTYNCILLKMSTWYSKHVEENIWRINNIRCITLVFCMVEDIIISHRFHSENKSAAIHFYYRFMSRHPGVYCWTAASTSIMRECAYWNDGNYSSCRGQTDEHKVIWHLHPITEDNLHKTDTTKKVSSLPYGRHHRIAWKNKHVLVKTKYLLQVLSRMSWEGRRSTFWQNRQRNKKTHSDGRRWRRNSTWKEKPQLRQKSISIILGQFCVTRYIQCVQPKE